MAPSKGEGVYCLTLTCLSVCKNKFLSKISYPLLTADALNFNALFVEACHMVGLIFLQIPCHFQYFILVCVTRMVFIKYLFEVLYAFKVRYST